MRCHDTTVHVKWGSLRSLFSDLKPSIIFGEIPVLDIWLGRNSPSEFLNIQHISIPISRYQLTTMFGIPWKFKWNSMISWLNLFSMGLFGVVRSILPPSLYLRSVINILEWWDLAWYTQAKEIQ